jgi:hypothetical protein
MRTGSGCEDGNRKTSVTASEHSRVRSRDSAGLPSPPNITMHNTQKMLTENSLRPDAHHSFPSLLFHCKYYAPLPNLIFSRSREMTIFLGEVEL